MAPEETAANKVEKFFSTHTLRHYAKGQVLLLAGDTVHEIFYLVSGRVKQYDVTYRGDEIILNVYKEGAFFPMSNALSAEPVTCVFEAETDVEIRQAPAQDVVAFLKADPAVLLDLLRRLYRGMDGLLGRITHLMAGSARSRLLYELVVEAKRFGDLQPDGSCILSISEKELGARAGLSRETVSREIHKLKDQNAVTVGTKDITLTSLKDLESLLGLEL